MKLQTGKIQVPKMNSDDPLCIEASVVKAKQKDISHYSSVARAHLDSLKKEIYSTIDAGDLKSLEYKTTEEDDGVNYEVAPSIFLEKAYCLQTYDKQGKGLANREQPYINAGLAFATSCNGPHLDSRKKLLNDTGKMIGAINSALSQLNKVEAQLLLGKFDEVGGLIPVLDRCITTVLDTAKDSAMIDIIPNQNFIQKVLSGLADVLGRLKGFLSNLGKSETEQYRDKFFKIKNQYNQNTDEPSTAPTPDSSDGAKP